MGVFRSEESAKKILTRLGNPAEDKFVPIVGNIGEYIASYKATVGGDKVLFNLGSEQNAADLQKKILAKVGTITDIVATVGGGSSKNELLQQSVEELRKVKNSCCSSLYTHMTWFICSVITRIFLMIRWHLTFLWPNTSYLLSKIGKERLTPS